MMFCDPRRANKKHDDDSNDWARCLVRFVVAPFHKMNMVEDHPPQHFHYRSVVVEPPSMSGDTSETVVIRPNHSSSNQRHDQHYSHFIPMEWQSIDQNDPNVTLLDAASLYLDDEKAIQLAKCLIGNTHLIDLRLRIGSDMTMRGARALVGGILGCRHLKALVAVCSELPLDMALLYVQPLAQMETLILAFPLDDHHAKYLGQALIGNTSLQTLLMEVENISFAGAKALAQGICHTKRLQSLQLAVRPGRRPSISAVQQLCRQGVQGCRTIQTLSFCGVLCPMADLATLLPRLRGLRLEDVTMSLAQIKILAQALRQTWKLQSLALAGCHLGDAHLRILSPVLGNHPSMINLDLKRNQLGDASMACFVEHWNHDHYDGDNESMTTAVATSMTMLDFQHNHIGPLGAQLLIRAMPHHRHHYHHQQPPYATRMYGLQLSHNTAIGYEGLEFIGRALAGKQVRELHLNHVARWRDYPDDESEAAVLQESKRWHASLALLEGVRGNVYLRRLELDACHLPVIVADEINCYVQANACGRRALLLTLQDDFPLGIWSHVLAKWTTRTNSSLIFLLLRELPTVFMTRGPSQSLL